MGSPFLAVFIDLCTGWMKVAPLTKVYVLYSELMLSMKTDSGLNGWSEEQLMELNYRIEKFKRSLIRKFSDHCYFGLHTLVGPLLHQVVKYLQEFGTSSVSNTSSFEQYSVIIKHGHRQTSRRSDTCTNETERTVGCKTDWTLTDSSM